MIRELYSGEPLTAAARDVIIQVVILHFVDMVVCSASIDYSMLMFWRLWLMVLLENLKLDIVGVKMWS